MNTFLQKTLLHEPKMQSAGFRYGFLAFILGLTIFSAVAAAHLSPSVSGRYFGFIVPPMLLFNHLAFQFRWSRPVAVALRAIAFVWIVVVGIYIFFVFLGK